MADHSGWAVQENATHLLAVLQGQAADILHSVPSGVTCEDVVGAPKSCYGDHHMVAACQSQLKVRTQLSASRHKNLQQLEQTVGSLGPCGVTQ
jgi:hypothetical protein